MDAWVAARGIVCLTAQSPRRATTRTTCEGKLSDSVLSDSVLSGSTLSDRKTKGALGQVLLARPDDGPVHYFSTLRRYSIPADAVVDYNAAIDALTAQLGPPARVVRADATAFDSKVARRAATWAFADLEVTLSALRTAPAYVSLTEQWAIPGVEANMAARPGTTAHGEIKAKPDGYNPHATEAAAPH